MTDNTELELTLFFLREDIPHKFHKDTFIGRSRKKMAIYTCKVKDYEQISFIKLKFGGIQDIEIYPVMA
jgi:hypothetical protein